MAIVQWRRATAAEWTAANPVLRQGEAGYEIGTGKFKIGDGTSTWSSLPYIGAGGGGGGGSSVPFAYPIPAGTANDAPLRASPKGQLSSGSAISMGNNKAPITTWPVPRPFTLTAFSLSVHTPADGGNIKFAIYGVNNRGLMANAPVYVSSGQVANAGAKHWNNLDVDMTDPFYYVVFGSYGFTATRALPNRGSGGIDYDGPSGNAGQPAAMSLSNFNESTGDFPSSPTIQTYNDGSSFWFAFNGDPL